jgi:Glycosyltransferase
MKEEKEDSHSFNLSSGWNTISFDCFENEKSHTKLLTCEKVIIDSTRELGVAIKEVGYFKNDCWEHFGIQEIGWKTYRFLQAKNVYLLGLVSEEEKLSIYQEASVAINPMMSGSGTNLKVLGYLASGIPLITTPIGARGLGLEHNKNAIICEIPDFPKNIYELLLDDEKALFLTKSGRELVETTYDWNVITRTMVDEISKLEG